MCKQAPKYINEICPSCHPREYVKTLAKFVEYDSETNEYLYKCVDCGAHIWADEQWVKDNAVEEAVVDGQTQAATIQQRNVYIHDKMLQLDKVTDARKHTKRLARIMTYHRLLTDVEVDFMRQRLYKAFGSLKGAGETI